MNAEASQKRPVLGSFKKGGTPIVCLTAYSAPMARLLDPFVDIILVGDSLGMVEYGFDSTRAVTLDMMIAHGAAVARAARKATVVVDMPFGTYDKSPDEALRNVRRVMQETGCAAVKCEGGQGMAATVKHLIQNAVPVMGHVGLLPQSAGPGGFKIQGRDEVQAEKVMQDAKAIAAAGVFAMVVEGVVEPLARAITEAVNVPTIGIGASMACDGQVLVINDLLGLTEKPPRFAKRYAELAPVIEAAVKAYAEEVRARTFPDPDHVYAKK